MANAVIIQPGIVSAVANGGTAVNALPPNISGAVITNPISNSDQGLSDAEPLFVNPIDEATLEGHGNTFALAPGQSWVGIPGQTTYTSVNAATSGHRFSIIWW